MAFLRLFAHHAFVHAVYVCLCSIAPNVFYLIAIVLHRIVLAFISIARYRHLFKTVPSTKTPQKRFYEIVCIPSHINTICLIAMITLCIIYEAKNRFDRDGGFIAHACIVLVVGITNIC